MRVTFRCFCAVPGHAGHAGRCYLCLFRAHSRKRLTPGVLVVIGHRDQAITAGRSESLLVTELQARVVVMRLQWFAASYCEAWCNRPLVRLGSNTGWYETRRFVPFGDAFFRSTVEYRRMKMELADF